MPARTKNLWSLVLDQPELDPQDLAAAIQEEAAEADLDFRTRLLIRDSLEALASRWGRDRLGQWLASSPVRKELDRIRCEELGEPGFPSLPGRVVEATRAESIRQFLRELGLNLQHPLRVYVGGSASLILPGHLSRHTEDIDLVDEVPGALRTQHELLQELKERFHLGLTHFQSHYLPERWEQRVRSLEPLGQLQVFLVDVYDVFLSKLFSARAKDRDDLRYLAPQLERETLERRLRDTTAKLRSDAALQANAEKNWYIVFGDTLPS